MPRHVVWEPPAVPFELRNVAPLGVTYEVLRRAHADGRITRLGHGVYIATGALPAEPDGRLVLRAVALQMRRPEAIASHTTAALAWNLPLIDTAAAIDGPLRFTMPPQPQRRSVTAADYSISLRSLPPHHRAQHPSGLFLTTPNRTAVDLAVDVPLPQALIALDAVVHQALVEAVGESRVREAYRQPHRIEAARRHLLEAVEAASTPRTRRQLQRVVALADPRRESALESQSYGYMICAQLPLPELQVEIPTPLGAFYADFLWPGARVIGEADGMTKLQSASDVQEQHLREEFLRQEQQYAFVRWTSGDIKRRPAAVMDRIGRRLWERGMEL